MGLYQEVKQELDNLDVEEQIADLVLAALKGEDDVERTLAGEDIEPPDTPVDPEEQVSPVYLQDITVSGFRGIGEEATLEIPPGPGLTVVVGRNGSGKSSFAEGLEVLLTGNSYRWEGKTVSWKKGWRNLHQGDNPKIVAKFQVEGRNRPTVVERTWSHDSKLEEGKSSVQHHGQTISDLDGIGWKEPLDLYRPILSYKELGIIENSPSTLYDIITKVLGIGVVTNAMKILADARLARQRTEKEAKKELFDNILPKFIEIKDEELRAESVVEYLTKHSRDWDRLIKFQPGPNPHYQDLQHLINIEIPDEGQVLEIAEEINKAYTDWSDLSSTEIEQEEEEYTLAQQALESHVYQDLESRVYEAREPMELEKEDQVTEAIDAMRVSRVEEMALERALELEDPVIGRKSSMKPLSLAGRRLARLVFNKAYTDWSDLSDPEIEQAERLVKILNLALEHYDAHENTPCPVCGVGILDSSWRISVVEQIERLKKASQRYRDAKNNMERVTKKAKSLVEPPQWPSSTIIETDSLIAKWEQWSSLPDDVGDISEHLLSLYSAVKEEAENTSKQAERIYFEREEKWLVAWSELSSWFSKARKVIDHLIEIPKIKGAEAVLKSVNENLRSTRWSPIEKRVLDIWKDLRLESNVDLRSVQLTGARLNRKVDLEVEVDNIKADALSVVSQGETSCLALSIFFPRVILTASPFRFLVIDDPVQSMDPARVDGLARLFAKIANDRQLIVFTHDNRLPESLRHLDIKHHCLEVRRSTKSKVTITEKRDPVIQYFFEARSILKDDDLQEDMARRVIPGFCRSGLEAACVEAVWRRRLGRGEPHEKINQELLRAKKLSQKASLVLFGDIKQAGKVYDTISSKWRNKRLATAYSDANKGTHGKYTGNLANLINDCQSLAERLRRYDA